MSLEIKNLNVSYAAIRAVDNVSITAKAGEVTAVVGANGAGKSSLLRACAGLVPATGEVLVNGVDVRGKSAEDVMRTGLAFVPEGRATIPDLTVEENLLLGGLTKAASASRGRANEMLGMFPALAARKNQHASVLSGGERQQLAIARALMPQPRVVLLDEPSLGLAPLIVNQILETVRQLAKINNVAVLLVEQNALKALKIADQAYVLGLGTIVAQGDAKEIAHDERLLHAYLGVA